MHEVAEVLLAKEGQGRSYHGHDALALTTTLCFHSFTRSGSSCKIGPMTAVGPVSPGCF